MAPKVELKCRWEKQKNVQITSNLISGLDDTPTYTKKYVCSMSTATEPVNTKPQSLLLKYKYEAIGIVVLVLLVIGILAIKFLKKSKNEKKSVTPSEQPKPVDSQPQYSLNVPERTDSFRTPSKPVQSPVHYSNFNTPKAVPSPSTPLSHYETPTATRIHDINLIPSTPLSEMKPIAEEIAVESPRKKEVLPAIPVELPKGPGPRCLCGCQYPTSADIFSNSDRSKVPHHSAEKYDPTKKIQNDDDDSYTTQFYDYNDHKTSVINEIYTRVVTFSQPLPPAPAPVVETIQIPDTHKVKRRFSFHGLMSNQSQSFHFGSSSASSSSSSSSSTTATATAATTPSSSNATTASTPAPSSSSANSSSSGSFLGIQVKRSLSFNGKSNNTPTLDYSHFPPPSTSFTGKNTFRNVLKGFSLTKNITAASSSSSSSSVNKNTTATSATSSSGNKTTKDLSELDMFDNLLLSSIETNGIGSINYLKQDSLSETTKSTDADSSSEDSTTYSPRGVADLLSPQLSNSSIGSLSSSTTSTSNMSAKKMYFKLTSSKLPESSMDNDGSEFN